MEKISINSRFCAQCTKDSKKLKDKDGKRTIDEFEAQWWLQELDDP